MTPLEQELLNLLVGTQFSAKGYCPLCGGWMCEPYGCTPKRHTLDCPIAIALKKAGV